MNKGSSNIKGRKRLKEHIYTGSPNTNPAITMPFMI